MLNDYVMWFSNNLLVLNQKKSHFIVFSHHCVTNNILPNLHSNGCTITRVNQIKFLGIIIDEDLCWKFHLSSVRDKITTRLFTSQVHINNAFILSYFKYCIIIWGNAHKKYLNPLLILQKHVVQLICRASFTAHCAPLAKQCNIFFVHDL